MRRRESWSTSSIIQHPARVLSETSECSHLFFHHFPRDQIDVLFLCMYRFGTPVEIFIPFICRFSSSHPSHLFKFAQFSHILKSYLNLGWTDGHYSGNGTNIISSCPGCSSFWLKLYLENRMNTSVFYNRTNSFRADETLDILNWFVFLQNFKYSTKQIKQMK